MFSIYNLDGRRFRDSLENLRKVQKVQASQKVRLQANVSDDETLATSSPNQRKNTGAKKALQAYQQTINHNPREPICHAHQLMTRPVATVQMDMEILAAHRYFQ